VQFGRCYVFEIDCLKVCEGEERLMNFFAQKLHVGNFILQVIDLYDYFRRVFIEWE
jgi:hypothetical protein